MPTNGRPKQHLFEAFRQILGPHDQHPGPRAGIYITTLDLPREENEIECLPGEKAIPPARVRPTPRTVHI